MSIFKLLISSPNDFISLSEKEHSMNILNVSKNDFFVFRMGEFKFKYASAFYSKVIASERMIRLEPSREETKEWPGNPERVASFKAEDHIDLVGLTKNYKNRLKTNDNIISVGQDVQLCTISGDPIYKPKSSATKDTLFSEMQKLLCKKEGNKFRLKSGFALYVNKHNDQSKGVMLSSEMRFSVSEFFPRELELYIYGISGKKGDNPPYLLAELKKLCADGLIDKNELEDYSSGISLDRLKQTNGGFRWPHPIFLKHITEINGIKADESNYRENLYELIMTFIGISSASILHLPEMINRLKTYKGKEKWQRLAVLKDGSLIHIRPIKIDDENELQTISEIIARNFNEHPNYAELSEKARAEYIKVNDAKGIKETASHPDNILAVVVENEDGIIAYSVVRKIEGNIAEGRRLHVRLDYNSKGIGTILHDEKIAMARFYGCTQLGSIASGSSDKFVEKNGYSLVGRKLNKKMKTRGVNVHVNYALKKI